MVFAISVLVGIPSVVDAAVTPLGEPIIVVDGPLETAGGEIQTGPVLSGDGQFVIYEDAVGGIRRFDTTNGAEDIVVAESAYAPAVSDDGRWVVYLQATTNGQSISRWDANTGTGTVLSESALSFGYPDISDDGSTVVWVDGTDTADGTVMVWRNGALFGSRPGWTETGISGNGRFVSYRDRDLQTLHRWDLNTNTISEVQWAGEVSDDGALIGAGGYDNGPVVVFHTVASGQNFVVPVREDLALNSPRPVLAGDGSAAIIHTTVPLTADDTGFTDAYRVDLETGAIDLVSTSVVGRFVDLSDDASIGLFVEQIDGPAYRIWLLDFEEMGAGPPVPVLVEDLAAPQLSDQVARLYRAFFLRDADAAGLRYWVAQRASGASVAGIADLFAGSAEFADLYGSLTDEAFVVLVYNNVLDRQPDSDGLTFWTGQLAGGASRGSVMTGFSESSEYTTKTNTTAASPAEAASVWRLYQAFFLRDADQAGFDFWYGEYSRTGSLEAIANAFVDSAEFIERYGELTDREFVSTVYGNVLGRTPDAAGFAFWQDELEGGMTRGQMMTSFSESAEFVIQTDSIPQQ